VFRLGRDAAISDVEFELNRMSAIRLMGASIKIPRRGESIASITQAESVHIGGIGSSAINGMTLMGLADAAMCAAVLSLAQSRRCATVNFSARFLRPSFKAPIHARGVILKFDGDLCVCRSQVQDRSGRKTVEAEATIQLVRRGTTNDES